MTLGNRGARILLALIIVIPVYAEISCAADQLVPEIPATVIPPEAPPTAPLPGTSDALGSVPPSPVAAAQSPQPTLLVPSPEPLPPAEMATPEASPSPKNNVVVDVKQDEPDWPNINKKKYLDYHSHWAAEFDIAPAALGRNLSLGGNDSSGNAVNNQPWGIGLAFEYQPEWFQKMGILSFGPSLSLYPSFSSNDDFPNAEAIWSIGAQIRYQARFKEQQFIVPMIGFNYEKVSYHLVTEGTGSLDISGPVLGIEVLLNSLDPDSSTAFYFDMGILKTYFVLEARLLEGDDGVMDVSGLSWFFGVRMEF
jgi:hypothetical protein